MGRRAHIHVFILIKLLFMGKSGEIINCFESGVKGKESPSDDYPAAELNLTGTWVASALPRHLFVMAKLTH
jgi:hypothetical protein